MQSSPANPGSIPAAEAGDAVRGVPVTPEQVSAAEAQRAGAHEGAEATGAEQAGLPQFRFEYWGGQIAWLLILFTLLYVLLARVFVPRLRRVRDERDAAIEGAIAEARRVQAEAEAQGLAATAEMNEARAKAQAAASDAKARAAAEAKARQAAQEAELNAKLAEAETRIQASRESAMGSMREVASDTAGAIVERLTGRPADAAELDAALGARG